MNETWITHRDRYDRMLAPYGAALMRASVLEPGDTVLDIGCGTGATTIAAAEAVGVNGCVVGVDIDDRFAAEARRRLAGTPNASVVTADAACYRLEPPVDVAISRFGTMLFADAIAAHRNIALNLGRHGRLVAVVWQTLEQNLWQSLPLRAVRSHVDLGPPKPRDEPGPFALAQPERVAAMLDRAGFDQPEFEAVEAPAWIATDIDDAVHFFAAEAGAGLRAMASGDTVREVLETLRELLAPYASPDGVVLPAAAWVITAPVRH